MPRALRWGALLALGLLAAGLFRGPVRAEEKALKGTYKLIVNQGLDEITLALVRVGGEGKASVEVVESAVPLFKGVAATDVKGDAKGVHFTLTGRGTPFRFSAYPVKGEEGVLLGSVQVRGSVEPVYLERTKDKEVDPKDVSRKAPGADLVKKLSGAGSTKEEDEAFKELTDQHPNRPIVLVGAERLVRSRADGKDDAALKAAVEQYLATAAAFGPELQGHATTQAATLLLSHDKALPLALELARKAEKELPTDATPAQQESTLRILARALRLNHKEDELKTVHARLEKVSEGLDAEYEKDAVPFKVEAYPGRKEKSKRVVVAELFTGAQCPPCVAADVAFDAMFKRYQPSELVQLQYHLHIPGADPLTNEASEKRAKYYGVRGTPTLQIDGKKGPALGGPKARGESSFEAAIKPIDEDLETAAAATVQATVKRDNMKLTIQAEGKLGEGAKPGEMMRLRVALIEDVVRYPANNGQRLHHHVVRAFPGGVEGFEFKEETVKQSLLVDVAELRKDLDAYLTKYAKEHEDDPFPDDIHALSLRHFKVVVFVQDDSSKEILNATQVDVPEAK